MLFKSLNAIYDFDTYSVLPALLICTRQSDGVVPLRITLLNEATLFQLMAVRHDGGEFPSAICITAGYKETSWFPLAYNQLGLLRELGLQFNYLRPSGE